jgi:hypothetical protein
MSQAGIFAFGCLVFFVVMTGAFFFGLATVRELAERDKPGGNSAQS